MKKKRLKINKNLKRIKPILRIKNKSSFEHNFFSEQFFVVSQSFCIKNSPPLEGWLTKSDGVAIPLLWRGG